jgi:hypothetical protein
MLMVAAECPGQGLFLDNLHDSDSWLLVIRARTGRVSGPSPQCENQATARLCDVNDRLRRKLALETFIPDSSRPLKRDSNFHSMITVIGPDTGR